MFLFGAVICCLVVGAIIYLSKSKYLYTWLYLNYVPNDAKKIKYNPKTHDPESKRIDGGGCCYPNCASDVWLRSCEREIIEPIEGHVDGHIPKWLNGSLLRNGPGNWKVGDMSFQHLFDCSALLHRFAIKNGHVTYQNRFIQTETLKKNSTAQRIVVTGFGTASVPDPCHSIFDKVSAIFRPDSASDNTMISIYPFGDEYYTFTEAPIIHRVNPRTLATEARVCVSDFVGVINHTSHPHVLPNGTVYNLGMAASRSGPTYNIICFPHGESMFEDVYVVGSVPCRWKLHPGYMHTFGITENYFVIVEQPLSISLTEFVKAQIYNQNLCSCLKWFENKPTLFHLMERKTGKVRYTFHSEAFFYLHIVNQYEEDNHVVIDICCYKDPEMINCMYLESIMNMQTNPNYASLFRGRPLRFVLPLGSNIDVPTTERCGSRKKLVKSFSLSGISARLQQPKLKHSESQHEDVTYIATNRKEQIQIGGLSEQNLSNESKQINYEKLVNLVTLKTTKAEAYQMSDRTIFVRPELLCDLGCETPRINYERFLGKKYRYFYAISSDVDADNPGTLIKVDLFNKTCQTWCENNCYPSEPVFVAAPNAQFEDDGVVLASMVWGGLKDNYVGLLVLCARTWTELGRCEFHADGPVPKCLHGWFAKDIV
ncbi:carotenoid isomerooxygenase isoform X1 [Teleopsis dalmanni]|uniref:carotenoid isomerooxygenase isoform X1 n=1 Tax=Teleopsis dalmanni TaxID=139649 RepID=UPI0018CCB28A|nr:carotenoid isomerooxygenase isoform X1 [Teleopsis dalmanni]